MSPPFSTDDEYFQQLSKLPCKGPGRAAWGLAAAVNTLRSISGPNPDTFTMAESSLEAAGEMLLEYPGSYEAAKQHGELALNHARESARLRKDLVTLYGQESGNEKREQLTAICQRHLQLSCDTEGLLLDVTRSFHCPDVPALTSIDWQLREIRDIIGETRITTPVVPLRSGSPDASNSPSDDSFSNQGGLDDSCMALMSSKVTKLSLGSGGSSSSSPGDSSSGAGRDDDQEKNKDARSTPGRDHDPDGCGDGADAPGHNDESPKDPNDEDDSAMPSSDANGAAAEGRTVGRADVLRLLKLLRQDDLRYGKIHIREFLTVKSAFNGKTAGAAIVRDKWSGKVLAFVKPSNEYNHPYSQMAGSSFLAAVPLPPNIKLLTAYSTVCPATSPGARILRELIAAEMAPAGDDAREESRNNNHLTKQLLEERTVLQLVGPVPHAQDLYILLKMNDGQLSKIKRERMAAILAADFGALIVLDLLSGSFVDRIHLGSPAWKHNVGNVMVMQRQGDSEQQVSLVAIDTDVVWDRVGQSVTEPASTPSRVKLQEKAESTLTSLRRWDARGAGMALRALRDVFGLEPSAMSDNEDAALALGGHEQHDVKMLMDLKSGMEMAVDTFHGDLHVFSDAHLDVIRRWLADVDGGGSWPQHLRAPYNDSGDGCVLEKMLSLAARPISPDGPLQAGPSLD